ncbi:diguanylate cyclase [Candidatus Sumerlaeota bacterium]|nr:diguanylate cyclase [Candidatus Sumerlaeota bacterium]
MNFEAIVENDLSFPGEPYSVLVVDDDPEQLELIEYSLKKEDFDVIVSSSANEALEILENRIPDIVLLDIVMPKMNGIEVLQHIHKDEKTSRIPVILISAYNDTPRIVQGLQEGANDYVTKPINFSVLVARMKTHIRIGQLLKRLETQTHVLSRMAAFDELTGSYNRRSMNQILELELSRSRRYNHHLSILMMDIDHFKEVNDRYGHITGDHVLQGFTCRVNSLLRTNDALCRYGGEEFLAILPETSEENAVRIANRVCSAISGEPFLIDDISVSITTSIGVISHSPLTAMTISELMERADRAMYKAKEKGRNCIYFLSEKEGE